MWTSGSRIRNGNQHLFCVFPSCRTPYRTLASFDFLHKHIGNRHYYQAHFTNEKTVPREIMWLLSGHLVVNSGSKMCSPSITHVIAHKGSYLFHVYYFFTGSMALWSFLRLLDILQLTGYSPHRVSVLSFSHGPKPPLISDTEHLSLVCIWWFHGS